jgi:hypothetical protein
MKKLEITKTGDKRTFPRLLNLTLHHTGSDIRIMDPCQDFNTRINMKIRNDRS